MSVYVFDVETDHKAQGRIIEAAWQQYPADQKPLEALQQCLSSFEQRYHPQRPISPATMAIHHIIDEDVVHSPSYLEFAFPVEATYVIGHNIDFDMSVLTEPTNHVRRICTLALARRIWLNLDGYNLSALLYALLPQNEARAMVHQAHEALADVKNCKKLLELILIELANRQHAPESWEKLWLLSERAREPKAMEFGKHKGTPIAQVPEDYIRWYLKQDQPDLYLLKAFQKHFPHLF